MGFVNNAIATLQQHLLGRRRDKAAFVLPLTMAAIVFVTVVLTSELTGGNSPYDYGLAAFRTLVGSTLILSTDEYLSPPPPPKMLALAETIATCKPLSDVEQYDRQVKVVASFFDAAQHYPQMVTDIREATDHVQSPRHAGIVRYLTERVLRPQWSILDLGCGTGEVMKAIQDHYHQHPAAPADPIPVARDGQIFVGIELTDAFVKETEVEMLARGIDVYQGEHLYVHTSRLEADACHDEFYLLLSCPSISIDRSIRRFLMLFIRSYINRRHYRVRLPPTLRGRNLRLHHADRCN